MARYRFEPFVLDLDRGTLEGPEGLIHLRPRTFAVLKVLVEQSPRLVPRDELIDCVWESQFVTAAALTQTISELRTALGDSREQPRFVDTVPRKGYRFAAPVGKEEARRLPAEAVRGVKRPLPRAATRVGLVVGAVALALALLFLDPLRVRSPAPEPPNPAPTQRPRAVVMDFVDRSDDSAHSWLSTALAERLRIELIGNPNLEVVPGDHLPRRSFAEPVHQPSDGELGSLVSAYEADYVIYGSFSVTGSAETDLNVTLNVTAMSRTGDEFEGTLTGNADELQDLVRRAVAKILAATHLNAAAQPTSWANTALPMGLHVLQPFAEGLAALRAYEAQAALAPLQRAAQAAPASPLTHWAMARAWRQLGWDNRAQSEAQQARRLAKDLPPELRLPIEALEAELSGNWIKAVRLYQALNTFYPDDLDYALQLIDAQIAAGQAQEALEDVERFRDEGRADPLLNLRLDLAEARLAGALGAEKRRIEAAERAAKGARAQGRQALVADATEQLARGFERLGDVRAARERYAEARELFAACGNTWRVAIIRHTEAELALRLGEFDEAEKTLSELDDVVERMGNRRGRIRCLVLRARIHQFRAEHSSALPLYNEALEICRKTGFVKGVSLVQNDLAAALAHSGRIDEAIEILREVIIQNRDRGDRPAEAASLANLGAFLALNGLIREAVSASDQALSLFRELGNSWGEANVLENLGLLHGQLGDPQRAEDQLVEALSLYRQLDRKPKVLGCWISLGSASRARGELGQARERFGEALGLARALHDRIATARATSMLLATALDRGDVTRATKLRDELAELSQFFEDPYDESVSLVEQGRLAALTDNTVLASQLIERACERAAASNQPLQVEHARLQRAELALARDSTSKDLAAEIANIAEAFRDLDFPSGVAWAECLRGDALVRADLPEKARAALLTSRDSSAAGLLMLRQKLLEGRIELRQGRLDVARTLAASTRQEATARGLMIEALEAGLLAADVALAEGQTAKARQLLEAIVEKSAKSQLAVFERRAMEVLASRCGPQSAFLTKVRGEGLKTQ